MRCIIVFFDSLNKRMLEPYGCDWVHTPNFSRLAEKAVTFDNSYVGSMPCMPARRDLHTGRLNFLHRGWGPMEPYDVSVFELLKNAGVYTHLISDHGHYWEEGGATYHTKYNSYEHVRGQEGDFWKAQVGKIPDTSQMLGRNDACRARDEVNRRYLHREEDYPISQVFRLGEEFLRENKDADRWVLQIETFDPHEPFLAHERYRALYPDGYEGPPFDWPDYVKVRETPQQVQHILSQNAALVSACDEHLGKILDLMDRQEMWDDTMLLVCTDHGYLLGEHGWWAKSRQPIFNEIANTPFFLWDPRCQKRNERREQLVQLIDVAPTLLDFFGQEIPASMLGAPLGDCLERNGPTHEAILYGYHGCHVTVADGQYTYMRAPAKEENGPLFDYCLMPSDMHRPFALERLRKAELVKEPFSFCQGAPLLQVPAKAWAAIDFQEYGTLLYDVQKDPGQLSPLERPGEEARLSRLMAELMKENESPAEQYIRLGLAE